MPLAAARIALRRSFDREGRKFNPRSENATQQKGLLRAGLVANPTLVAGTRNQRYLHLDHAIL
jgi:hypothetical protein